MLGRDILDRVRPGTSAGVCEDDDELRGVLRSALERKGFAVRATASGSEAVRAFAQDAPDVLVLDIGLPDADGRDVCQALRARGVTSPVLFLTARDALPDRISGFQAGGDDYLIKPFALSELLVRVQALLRNITFRNTSDNPPAVARTVRAFLTDGDGEAVGRTKQITIVRVNDAPVLGDISEAAPNN